MPAFSFRTIQNPAEGIYKEKGSKFLAFAFPVGSEGDIKARVESLKKEYFDARHHCFAWVLGPEKDRFRAFDDGEPNHSAGDPILGQIKSKDLTNVLIVVVRYFGGVKLGVGGLISAYREAAIAALNHAAIVEREVMEAYTLSYDFNATPQIMKLVKELDLIVGEQGFDERAIMKIQVSARNSESFSAQIKLLQDLGSRITLVED